MLSSLDAQQSAHAGGQLADLLEGVPARSSLHHARGGVGPAFFAGRIVHRTGIRVRPDDDGGGGRPLVAENDDAVWKALAVKVERRRAGCTGPTVEIAFD